MANRLNNRAPVIVGVGEITDRQNDPMEAMEPLDLLQTAAARAADDAGIDVCGVDLLHVVNVMSWPYRDIPASLVQRTGMSPRSTSYGGIGGEMPLTHLHAVARAIARGESEIAMVCGAEAFAAVNAAARAGLELPWTTKDENRAKVTRLTDVLSAHTLEHGLNVPLRIYPFYENACQMAWGQTPREGCAESAQIWSDLSHVAARNPYAWLQRVHGASEIAEPSAANRLVAWPYTKLMIAQPGVNQGCALIVMSYARARALEIPENRMIFIRGGATAWEPRDILARDHYHGSVAMNAVLAAATKMSDKRSNGFDMVELYSCFPTVPKMARRSLYLSSSTPLTVTGGLTFFGAPLSNYMSHAAAAMVRSLRGGSGEAGLLYGQGEIVTKHHALVLSRTPPHDVDGLAREDQSTQDAADAARGPLPPIDPGYRGPAEIETYTVVYDRESKPEFGVVIAKARSGARLLARIPGSNRHEIEILTALDRSAVGLQGSVIQGEDTLGEWVMA